MIEIKFAKLKKGATIPSKDPENAGYDIYPVIDEPYMEIKPGETVLVPTGICSAFPQDYVMILKERGSTGKLGIGQRSGVIDSGYRGEWFVPITNHDLNRNLIISNLDKENLLDHDYFDFEEVTGIKYENLSVGFTQLEKRIVYKEMFERNYIFYPAHKAIAQAILLPVPETEVVESTVDEIKAIKSKRGEGALGSSGK